MAAINNDWLDALKDPNGLKTFVNIPSHTIRNCLKQ